MILPDDVTPTMLSHWMIENNMSRNQLADLFGLTKASIDRWMSVGTIPNYRKIRIAQTINAHKTYQQDHLRINAPCGRVQTGTSLYTAHEWERLRKAAEIMGISTEEFQQRAVVWAMKALQKIPSDHLPQKDSASP